VRHGEEGTEREAERASAHTGAPAMQGEKESVQSDSTRRLVPGNITTGAHTLSWKGHVPQRIKEGHSCTPSIASTGSPSRRVLSPAARAR
jgi:hypothetical protein